MKLFESYLVGRKQLVKINLMSGLTFSDALDLTQGSISGPLLFINFKNDLPDFVNFPTYSFADDTSTILCEKEATSQLEEVFHKAPWSNADNSTDSNSENYDQQEDAWSSWSDWSPCSRTCDGGASYQLRRCNSLAGCKGEPVRYRICNMQPCPDGIEFRAEQCALYSSETANWTPYWSAENPCALTCVSTSGEVVTLASRVRDGTRCRPGSLDMCIDGKCKRVGCDLEIDSNLRVDACGVCGGDGSSCSQPLYHWSPTSRSLCSVSCGGGHKNAEPVCLNRVTGAEVQPELCDATQKPDVSSVECNMHACPPKWHAEPWGRCTVSCGKGVRSRRVHCVQEINGTTTKVATHLCEYRTHKPRSHETCNLGPCPPTWESGPWSACSKSCGEGVQTREVTCKPSEVDPSLVCDPSNKPVQSRRCKTGIPCSEEEDENDSNKESLGSQSYSFLKATAEKLVSELNNVPSESTWIAEEWGPCSVTCGEGTRSRQVQCKIFLDFSRTVARLPDKQCTGPKPKDSQHCVEPPCPASNRVETVRDGFADSYKSGMRYSDERAKSAPSFAGKSTYSWRTNGFNQCTASCLGGMQTSLIQCIRDEDGKVSSPWMCDASQRPDELTQLCNNHPCPPRWNVSEWSGCSHNCGLGSQTRTVTCIHETTQSPVTTPIVPPDRCSQPPPAGTRSCNVLDCPIKWHTSEWSACSKPCGGGKKTRKVQCKQVLAQNHIQDKHESLCPASEKPPDSRPCNTKECPKESNQPIIESTDTPYNQANLMKRKVQFKIGGPAVIFQGTTIKIKCPVKRFDKAKIKWAKNHIVIKNFTSKYRISKKGALRINTVVNSDSGIYTCIAGLSSADTTLTVKPRPGQFISSEEIDGGKVLLDPGVKPNEDMGKGFVDNPSDSDWSHENPSTAQQSGHTNPKKRPNKQLDSTTTGNPVPKLDNGIEANSFLNSSDPPNSSSTSGGSRLVPHFQFLFISLQNFASSRMMMEELSDLSDLEFNEEETTDQDVASDGFDDLSSPPLILGKGDRKDVKFEWALSDWSKCSQPCGGSGFQTREAHCVVKVGNTTENVGNTICIDAGLKTPENVRKCGMEECPQWHSSSWQPCHEARCFSLDTAMQRREVKCLAGNGTEITSAFCDEANKPILRRECYNNECKGVWKVGEWSPCAAACDSEGVKYRILKCVWFGTKKPAGNACRDLPKPSITKSCLGVPCSHVADCRDESKYCFNVRAMNMCKLYRYQMQCCQSCKQVVVDGYLKK